MGGDHRHSATRYKEEAAKKMNKNGVVKIIGDTCCPGRSLLLLNGLQLSIDPLQF